MACGQIHRAAAAADWLGLPETHRHTIDCYGRRLRGKAPRGKDSLWTFADVWFTGGGGTTVVANPGGSPADAPDDRHDCRDNGLRDTRWWRWWRHAG